ncbi:MAG: recombinase family protein, partial [Lentisphaeria bacterium]|nr:recombinase family protein [Lentisphaeria bacterium]
MEEKPKRVRCAVYTRKSVEEGLEMEFNSLDAQREAGEAYIASQRANGWVCLPDRYDDGGFSGGNMNRPALKRLLADAEDGKIDIIVVYKLDRLSRSICDFAELSKWFDKWNVAFVSVTQEINTSTSSGRMMLNILMTFAQFEREQIAERVRDKMSASRKKGKWVGGSVPIGYKVVDKKLVPDEETVPIVKRIFQRYLEIQSPTMI